MEKNCILNHSINHSPSLFDAPRTKAPDNILSPQLDVLNDPGILRKSIESKTVLLFNGREPAKLTSQACPLIMYGTGRHPVFTQRA